MAQEQRGVARTRGGREGRAWDRGGVRVQDPIGAWEQKKGSGSRGAETWIDGMGQEWSGAKALGLRSGSGPGWGLDSGLGLGHHRHGLRAEGNLMEQGNRSGALWGSPWWLVPPGRLSSLRSEGRPVYAEAGQTHARGH